MALATEVREMREVVATRVVEEVTKVVVRVATTTTTTC